MDFNNLNNDDINKIINGLKYPKNKLSFEKINQTISSLFGKIEIDENIIDDDDVVYILHIYRGKRSAQRFSIHLRLKEFHDHIVRVDINPSNRHENPDGSIVTGSHIHIYSNQYEKRDRIAIPLEVSDFPNVEQIVETYSAFIDYTSIQKEQDDDQV